MFSFSGSAVLYRSSLPCKPDYSKIIRYNGAIIRRTPFGWQAEINRQPHRLRRTFADQERAKGWIDQRRTELTNEGLAAMALSERHRAEAARAIAALGGVPLMTAVEFWLLHHGPGKRQITIAQLYNEFMAEKVQVNLRHRSIESLRTHLVPMLAALGEMPVHQVTTGHLRAWLDGKRLSPATRRNYQVYLGGLFNYAVREGFLQASPAAGLQRPRVDEALPDVFSPSDLHLLLSTAWETPALRPLTPWLAIGAFAGLRTAELDGLDWRHVDLAAGLITVTPAVAKRRRQRYVAIQPCLADWLRAGASRAGRVIPPDSTRRRLLSRLLAATGVHWVRNGLRHSFGSYHLAAFNDAARTALEMGHSGSTVVLFQHYRALVRPEAAAAFWQIRPPAPDPGQTPGHPSAVAHAPPAIPATHPR